MAEALETIPLDACEKGAAYLLRSRNLAVGVFDGETGFVGIREKFGHRYLFTEYHEDTGPPFGTVRPIVRLEHCPFEDLRENLDTQCGNCGADVEFVPDQPDQPTPGTWVHRGETLCIDASPLAPLNKVLFDWLDERQDDWLKENAL